MATGTSSRLVRLEGTRIVLMHHFLGWQCRVRQLAVREGDGRPTPGMRPSLSVGGRALGAITVVLNRLPEHSLVPELRFIVQRTQEPLERWETAMRLLQGTYFQKPHAFSDELTALFVEGGAIPQAVLEAGACELAFEQFGQRYRLPCTARKLTAGEPLFEATYWHNALFNPRLPPGITILGFKPDWDRAEADPSPV
ncbi:hypothetical protein [Benzoatithermus flavus]|uniref:Uncharacterized protein n=1 Tax=Benzoatithermus flavus TaxID=3108223 RepID=A0ABU8XS60_9PROT